MEENVKKWLSEENFLKEVQYDENAEFHFIIEFPKDNIMDVVQPKNKDCIVIACATQVSPEHLTLMNNADIKNRKNFLRGLNFELNKYLVDFELQVSGDILQKFVVTEQIFEDGLSKNELIKGLKKVFKAKLHCIIAIDDVFGSIDQPSNENHMFV